MDGAGQLVESVAFKPARPTVILVVGMREAGAEVTSGVLQRLGVAVPSRDIDATIGSVSGSRECQGVARFNAALLERLGARWDSLVAPKAGAIDALARLALRDSLDDLLSAELPEAGLCLLEDAGLSVTASFWADVVVGRGRDARAILAMRAPAEVALLLEKQSDLPRPLGLTLWLHRALATERATRGLRRSVLLHDDLVADWRGTLMKVGADLGLCWPVSPSGAGSEIDGYLHAELRPHRHTSRPPCDVDAVEALCARAWAALRRLAIYPSDIDALAELDLVERQVRDALDLYGGVIASLQRLLWRAKADAETERAAIISCWAARVREHDERWAIRLEEQAKAAADREAAFAERLSEADRALCDQTNEAARKTNEVSRLKEDLALRLAICREEAELVGKRLRALETSTSWRLTAPLRAVARRAPVLARIARPMLRVGKRALRAALRVARGRMAPAPVPQGAAALPPGAAATEPSPEQLLALQSAALGLDRPARTGCRVAVGVVTFGNDAEEL